MKILLLLLVFCLCMNAKENLHSLLKIQLTQEEYLATFQTMKRKGLMYCINTFKSDGKVLQNIALAEQFLSIEQEFAQTFYQQYPQILSMKNSWNANKTGNVAFEYMKRYINTNIPFMVYYQTHTPYNRFPISIQETNAIDYLNSFLQEPVTEIATYFIPCMQLYDSKEYQEYVAKVIDFIICKNCKSYKIQDTQKHQTIYDEIVSLAKMQGFAHCVIDLDENFKYQHFHFYKTTSDDMREGYFLLSRFLAAYEHKYDEHAIAEEIDMYINSLSTNSTYINDKTPHIAKCIHMYDSKEYQDEVERIVKKYCKDCK